MSTDRSILLAAILMIVPSAGCDPQGPEFFEIVAVPGTGSILGIVTVDDVARPDAVVVLDRNGTTVDTFVTDVEGRFAFPNIQPGGMNSGFSRESNQLLPKPELDR